MEHPDLQSGSKRDFECGDTVTGASALKSVLERSPGSAEVTASPRGVDKARWYTRLAAIAAMLATAGCASDESGLNEKNAGFADGMIESAEASPRLPELQLQLDGGRRAGISLFFAKNRIYDFKLTSVDNPEDTVTVSSSGEKVELLEAEFAQHTSGYTVEAFDDAGKKVPINQSRQEGTIYGPDRF